MEVVLLEFNSSTKKYYIYSAIISLFSLLLFFINENFTDVIALTTSICVGLLPFLIDGNVFLNDTVYYREDKTFKHLRGFTKLVVFLILVIVGIKLLIIIPLFDTPSNENLLYLCFNKNTEFNRLNSYCETFMSKMLSIRAFCIYYAIIFVLSVTMRLINSHYYRKKIESYRTKHEKNDKDDNDDSDE